MLLAGCWCGVGVFLGGVGCVVWRVFERGAFWEQLAGGVFGSCLWRLAGFVVLVLDWAREEWIVELGELLVWWLFWARLAGVVVGAGAFLAGDWRGR